MKREIDFSVILPVCHGGRFLLNALESFRTIEYPLDRLELIIVGSHTDNESREAVIAEANSVVYPVSYIPCNQSGRSAELNAAIIAARGHILVFADDDCLFKPDWLKRFADVFKRVPDAGIVGGRDKPVHGESSFNCALDYVLNSFIGTGGLRGGGGLRAGKYYPKLWNMAVPYDVAMKAGGLAGEGLLQVFNESLSVHEDVDLTIRVEKLGKQIIFSPDICVEHYRDTDFTSFIRRNFAMARISSALGIHRVPHASLLILVFSLAGMSLGSVFLSELRPVFLIFTGLYVFILLSSALRCFIQTKKIMVSVLVPILLVSLHFSRGLGYLFPLDLTVKKAMA